MDTLVGRQLGKYRIESLLGRGGMAAVYKAQDTVLNRAVAIKVLEPALAVDPRAVERFRREAVTAANLEHPSIVRVFDVQQAGRLMGFVTRLPDVLSGAVAVANVQTVQNVVNASGHKDRGHRFLADVLDGFFHALEGTAPGDDERGGLNSDLTGVSYKVGAIGWPGATAGPVKLMLTFSLK